MMCEFCGGQTVQRRMTKQHWFHKQLYVIEDVPAEVCQECGERYFHAQVLDRIDQILQSEHVVKARLQVEVVSLPNMAVAA
jgi:YgiT-type zinc finger domain-containing protein